MLCIGSQFYALLARCAIAKGRRKDFHSYRFTVVVAASNFSMRPAKEVSICANEVGDKRVPFKQLLHPTPRVTYFGTKVEVPTTLISILTTKQNSYREQMPFLFEKEKILRWRDAKISPD